uniref:M14 family metallopeptidase n=1 Tax=Marinobacterium profundum TaxID=1714300 RepID=UPI000B097102|nr:M14-type cytosolic carboxypeptidase [Marinobacterium profundum]
MITISSQFDGGNIDTVDTREPSNILLNIKPDHESDFYQWFYFRLQGAQGVKCRMHILNAGTAAYPDGWRDYSTVASYDRVNWFRVPTRFEDGRLTIEHCPDKGLVWYAYFAPYSGERHQDLLARALASPDCQYASLGQTLDGRELDLLTVGQPGPGKRVIWLTARQHPGETMAEWFMEGLLERLLDNQDSVARELLSKAVFYLVPNMNPDGSARGHLRTNAAGVNLNREWTGPRLERSPEVHYVLVRMEQTGVDLFLDIHGDEVLPYNFLAGCGGNPSFSEKQRQLESQFRQDLLAASDEFQLEYGYADDQFGQEALTLAANQVGHRFNCLAMTLEMPFKDNSNRPAPSEGWSPERSKKLGSTVLTPILKAI